MGFCYLCDTKLHSEKARVCSSITPHTNVPYAEKIAELMGEEFVIIVTPADHMCKNCTSLLTHMDKLENELKLVKSVLLSRVQKKYGILPADQPLKNLEVVNGRLKTTELEVGQRKVPSGLHFKNNSNNSSPKMLKPIHDNASQMKIYKCGFCTYQSKELGHVRFHMRTHAQKNDVEKANQTVTKTKASMQRQPQKKRLYKCQVCSASFDSRITCLDHINKNHNQEISTNEAKVVETNSSESWTKVLKSNGNEQALSVTNVEGQQQNKGAVYTVTLNDHVTIKGIGSTKHDEPKKVENKVFDKEAMQVGQEIVHNIVKAVGENIMVMGGEDNKLEDLDIESMLAAIHNEPPSNA